LEAGLVGRWFGMDPVAHLRDDKERRLIRVAAYLGSARLIAEARKRAEGG